MVIPSSFQFSLIRKVKSLKTWTSQTKNTKTWKFDGDFDSWTYQFFFCQIRSNYEQSIRQTSFCPDYKVKESPGRIKFYFFLLLDLIPKRSNKKNWPTTTSQENAENAVNLQIWLLKKSEVLFYFWSGSIVPYACIFKFLPIILLHLTHIPQRDKNSKKKKEGSYTGFQLTYSLLSFLRLYNLLTSHFWYNNRKIWNSNKKSH